MTRITSWRASKTIWSVPADSCGLRNYTENVQTEEVMIIPIGAYRLMWRNMTRKQRIWAFAVFMFFAGLLLLEFAMGWVK